MEAELLLSHLMVQDTAATLPRCHSRSPCAAQAGDQPGDNSQPVLPLLPDWLSQKAGAVNDVILSCCQVKASYLQNTKEKYEINVRT